MGNSFVKLQTNKKIQWRSVGGKLSDFFYIFFIENVITIVLENSAECEESVCSQEKEFLFSWSFLCPPAIVDSKYPIECNL